MSRLPGSWTNSPQPWVCWLVLLLGLPATHAANPVLAWNAVALDTIRFDNMPPPAASRQLAILHAAMFDAVNGLSGPM